VPRNGATAPAVAAPEVDPLATGALGLSAAWASGINVYAVVLTISLLDMAGWIDLPPQLAPPDPTVPS